MKTSLSNFKICLVFVAGSVFFLSPIIVATGQVPQIADHRVDSRSRDFLNDLAEINGFTERRDLTGLDRFVSTLNRRWKAEPEDYAELMYAASTSVSSKNFGNYAEVPFVPKYANAGLSVDPPGLVVRVKLLELTSDLTNQIGTAAWKTWRKERATMIVRTWRELDLSVDTEFLSKYDGEADIPIEVPAPGFPGPVDPSMIKDPKVRAEYARAVAANNLLLDKLNRQTDLKKLSDEFEPYAEGLLYVLYTSPPTDRKELVSILGTGKISLTEQKIVLAAVDKHVPPM